jgi:LysM repeat protein
MKKVIRLTESDLTRIVRRVIEEQTNITNTELADGKRTGCYKVKLGDSALAIAKKFGITLDDIKSLNGGNLDDIRPGQMLRVQNRTKFQGC